MADNEETAMLYHAYSHCIYHYLLSFCHNPDTAEDLLQSTFLKVVAGISGFRGDCAIKTWIFTIARREYFHWIKKNPSHISWEEYNLSSTVQATQHAPQEQVDQVLSLIRSFPEPHQSLLLLRLVGELPYREIGIALGKSENWARVTFMRDKSKLLQQLKEESE